MLATVAVTATVRKVPAMAPALAMEPAMEPVMEPAMATGRVVETALVKATQARRLEMICAFATHFWR